MIASDNGFDGLPPHIGAGTEMGQHLGGRPLAWLGSSPRLGRCGDGGESDETVGCFAEDGLDLLDGHRAAGHQDILPASRSRFHVGPRMAKRGWCRRPDMTDLLPSIGAQLTNPSLARTPGVIDVLPAIGDCLLVVSRTSDRFATTWRAERSPGVCCIEVVDAG